MKRKKWLMQLFMFLIHYTMILFAFSVLLFTFFGSLFVALKWKMRKYRFRSEMSYSPRLRKSEAIISEHRNDCLKTWQEQRKLFALAHANKNCSRKRNKIQKMSQSFECHRILHFFHAVCIQSVPVDPFYVSWILCSFFFSSLFSFVFSVLCFSQEIFLPLSCLSSSFLPSLVTTINEQTKD